MAQQPVVDHRQQVALHRDRLLGQLDEALTVENFVRVCSKLMQLARELGIDGPSRKEVVENALLYAARWSDGVVSMQERALIDLIVIRGPDLIEQIYQISPEKYKPQVRRCCFRCMR